MIMDSEVSSPRRDGLVPQNKTLYNQLFIGVCGIAILLTILMLTWVFKYLGGIGFSSPLIVFNFHPLLMMFGFVLIFGKAMLIYRSFRGQVKPKLKLLHAILNGSVIFVCFLGSLSVLYFHHEAKIPHFYSLHSWLGILTWTLFLGQFSGGFIAFMYPGASYSIRSMMMPFHRFAGVATFVLASATCLTGLNEKAIFAFNGQGGNAKYSDLSGAGILTNVIAIVLVAFVSMVVYLVTRPDFKRIPLPEEQVISLNFDLTSNN
ncbi:hypothetical protein RDWZM_010548 [Blomia tropicalis]|uniref:Cytochrome b561 domain-containing protein n=1 Tax=Blomia tropicalis TaxID=40697 RepID=A0A9Q0LWY8_BLOTA|nr:hypothetical protein RDWZM_010548 [Blomia tropicalis]